MLANISTTTSISAFLFIATTQANAADFGGDRCAELEATTARKGNRKVQLTVSGHLSTAVLFWDDGKESNTYVVGNKNDQSNFTGDAAISSDLTAACTITLRLCDTLSDEVTQDTDDPEFGFTLWGANWFLESKRAGKLIAG